MFALHEQVGEGGVVVDVAFTDVSVDLREPEAGPGTLDRALRLVQQAAGVPVVRMRQVHAAGVAVVSGADPADPPAEADALVTDRPGIALATRVADCVPVLLADPAAGVVAAVHAGRRGVLAGVVPRAVAAMGGLGATRVRAWVGPHVCGACYEVPAGMRDEVAAAVPATYACTRRGTPALDLGAGVVAQLADLGCAVTEIGGCTMEDPRWHSHRRDGAAAGRFAGLVWRSGAPPGPSGGPG